MLMRNNGRHLCKKGDWGLPPPLNKWTFSIYHLHLRNQPLELYQRSIWFPRLFSNFHNWWCRKITNEPHSPRTLEIVSTQQKKRLTESTGVVPVKYLPKVKLESFRNFRLLTLRSIMRTYFLKVFGFL